MRALLLWTCGLALALSACGDDDPASSSQPEGSPSASDPESTQPAAETGSVDIGGGRQLHLNCTGSGSPTVILEAGDEDSGSAWAQVQPQIAEETRTCSYDRAGTGSSSPATGCRQLDDILDDLEALLDTAGIEPPYVLVGASGGGFLSAGFAARHPDDVAGLVLLETPQAITHLPPGLEEEIACDNPTNTERRDYVAVEHAAWDNRARLGDFPMRVVSNDYGAAVGKGDEATNVEDQRGWLVLSPNAKQVVIDSGHDVVFAEPDLVVRQIREVLARAKG